MEQKAFTAARCSGTFRANQKLQREDTSDENPVYEPQIKGRRDLTTFLEEATEQGFALTISEGIDVFCRTPNVCRGFCSHDVEEVLIQHRAPMGALSRPNDFSKRLPEQGFATFTRYWIEYALTTFYKVLREHCRAPMPFRKRSKEQGFALTTFTRC